MISSDYIHSALRSLRSPQRLKVVLPLLVVVLTAITLVLLKGGNSKRSKASPQQSVQTVTTHALTLQSYQVSYHSQAEVKAAHRTKLLAELAARVIFLSGHFEAGSAVRKGQVLLRLDSREAQAELEQAQAGLLTAQVALEEEQTRALLAKEEWQIVHAEEGGELPQPSDLTLRKPQVKAARANVLSARARVKRARMIVDRATVRAPYDAFVVSRVASLGQSLSPGTLIGEVISANNLQLNLPLTVEQASALQKGNKAAVQGIPVDIRYGELRWSLQISRMAQQVDPNTRKVHAVIDINRGKNPALANLKAGLFVEATIFGPRVDNVYVVPISLLDRNGRVPIYRDGLLHWQAVKLLGNDGENIWFNQGIKAGGQLVTTRVDKLPAGARLELVDQTNESEPKKQ